MWKENSDKRIEEIANENKTPETPAKKSRGFAAISPERRREISSKGGKAAHAAGTAHEFTRAEAVEAGKKGGTAPHVSRGGGRRHKAPSPVVPPLIEPSPDSDLDP